MRRVARSLAWPFRRFRRARWPAKAAIVLGTLVALPILFLVILYLLPPNTAVALGEPVLAWLSDAPPLPGNLDPVSERSVLLAADGSELATLVDDKNRVRVGLDEVSDVTIDALLAAEDDDFYNHPGVDHRAVMRAALANLRSSDVEQGGSTLTQQLVKNVYLDSSQTLTRKLTEAWYALQLEKRLSKDQILERYLNEAYFGQGAYGIEAAAELYFNTSADKLDARQAATLVGIIPSPSAQNPIDDQQAARDARDRVLQRMADTERLPQARADEAAKRGLGLDITPPPPPDEPFFVAYIRQALARDPVFDEALGKDPVRRERLVYGGGLTVHTTLDPKLQDHATRAIADVMGDAASSPLATLVTVEPATGAVRAMAVGPKAFGQCKKDTKNCPRTMVNPVTAGLGGSGRQPGSAFKPFVLAAALGEGLPPGWEQRTGEGKPIEGCDDDGRPYEPDNYTLDPGIKDMRDAIRVSNNVYHAKLAGMLGPEALIEAAEGAGLVNGELPEECSLALGSGSAYPLAMASAFATFANGGQRCVPIAVTRIEFGAAAGGGDARFEPNCQRAIDGERAAQLTELLTEPVEGGTATAAQLDRDVAGKTGTTDDYKDAWFVGYVPQLATAAWMGYEQPRVMKDVLGVSRVTGGTIPAQLWAQYMRQAVQDLEVKEFEEPPQPERVVVPKLQGQDAEDVREDYTEDYTFNVETRTVRNFRDAGTVVRHSPKAGREVEAGALLTLYVSNGKGAPPRVPNVIGMPRDRATRVLRKAGYRVEVVPDRRNGPRSSGDPAAGTVTATDPDPGTRLGADEVVAIAVRSYRRNDDEPRGPNDNRGNQSEPPGDRPGRPSPSPSPSPSASPSPSNSRSVSFGVIVADPPGNDLEHNGGEYVTLTTGRKKVDVSGWTIEYEGGGVLRIGAGYRMPAESELYVHTGTGDDAPPDRFFNDLTTEVLDNGGGVLILRDRQGREVARVRY